MRLSQNLQQIHNDFVPNVEFAMDLFITLFQLDRVAPWTTSYHWDSYPHIPPGLLLSFRVTLSPPAKSDSSSEKPETQSKYYTNTKLPWEKEWNPTLPF